MEERNKKSLTRTAKTDFQTRDEKEAGKVIEGYFAVFNSETEYLPFTESNSSCAYCHLTSRSSAFAIALS